jgi:hypothetical protein
MFFWSKIFYNNLLNWFVDIGLVELINILIILIKIFINIFKTKKK